MRASAQLADFKNSHGQFMDHFGFIVESPQAVDRMFEWVERNGVRIVKPSKRHWDGGYSFYLADQDGNTIQILHEPTIGALEPAPSKG